MDSETKASIVKIWSLTPTDISTITEALSRADLNGDMGDIYRVY